MSKKRPLLVLGVDGLDWDFVDTHRQELPVLAGLPVLRPLQSIFPPDSIPAWTTIFTGVAPEDHGILESIDYLDKRPARAAENAAEGLPNRTFWDELGRQGRRVCVVNPFLAYPAWPVNGVMVSGPVFVDGGVSVTGVDARELGDLPQLGGIVDFPTPRTMGRFVRDTLSTTRAQFEFGLRVFDRFSPDFLFINILTVDRMQHFAWRYFDPNDPTYPGPNPHQAAILRVYQEVDSALSSYLERGRVIALSDHGHGRRATRVLYVDELLRRHGLLAESRTRLRRTANATLETAKRTVLSASYKLALEEHAYRVARRLPNRKSLKQSSFSSDATRSAARLSRAFGRNPHSGVQVADAKNVDRVIEVLTDVIDPDTGDRVIDWIARREELVHGERADRYPEVLFKLKDGYAVDFGIYGPLFGPNVNHRRISGGHKEKGVLAMSFESEDVPADLLGMFRFLIRVG